VGATAASKTWYFAEGETDTGFDEYLTLQNPNASTAHVTVTYMLDSGSTIVKNYDLIATSRFTRFVKDDVGAVAGVSVKIDSDLPIVAERPMYFSYGVSGWTGGYDVVGATIPSPVWYFAEGWTGPGFDEYLVFQNPNGSTAHLTITYMLASGGPIVKTYNVNPTSHLRISVNGDVGPSQAVSVKIQSDLPIVAERPMYFSYQSATGTAWTGGHDAVGALAAFTTYYFAEGFTGGGFEEYLTLQNPNTSIAHVTITYMLADGSTIVKNYDLNATSRFTVLVNSDVGPDKAVSVKIQSDLPIMAERPMYFSYPSASGPLTGGHDVVGFQAP